MAPEQSTETTRSRENTPRIIPRSDHSISRQHISDEALKVLYRLHSLDFKAYLVGGGVRDLYLGKQPKDYDIATDAKPSRLKKIFRNCRIIGRRFRIAHVYFPGDKIVEVATFRRGEVQAIRKASGVVLLDNEYGTPEEDAKRRDLTINGLFYDIGTFSIIDYVGGVEDLENRIIRTIKDPDVSFQEDPVRMIRVLRHAARTGFSIERTTYEAIDRNRRELPTANPSRLMEETFKDLRSGAAVPFFTSLEDSGLLRALFPTLSEQLRRQGEDHPLFSRLRVLDSWIESGREVSNAVLITVLVHTVLVPHEEAWRGDAPNPRGIWPILQAGFSDATRHMRISRRDMERVFQIILAYPKLYQFLRSGGELSPSYQKKSYLGEALDFFELDLQASGREAEPLEAWRECARNIPERKRPTARSRSRRRRRGGRADRGGGGRREGAKKSPREPREAVAGEPPTKKKKKKQRKRRRRRPKKSAKPDTS